jgi:hypothetical protein
MPPAEKNPFAANETPFSSIEGGQEYLAMFSAAVEEAKQEALEMVAEQDANGPRWMEAVQLVKYKLEKLDHHIKVSRRLLNDLRTMRRLLLQERPHRVPSNGTRS